MNAPTMTHVPVGEVEQLQDPVDHREPERHERVDAPQRQAVDEQLDELVPVHEGLSHTRLIDERPTHGGGPLRAMRGSSSRPALYFPFVIL